MTFPAYWNGETVFLAHVVFETSLQKCFCLTQLRSKLCALLQLPGEPLLPQMESNDEGKICVVIDLDETLVHSSFKVSYIYIYLDYNDSVDLLTFLALVHMDPLALISIRLPY